MPTFQSTVTEIEQLAPDVLQITVSIHGEGFHFKSGQWLNFRFPEGISRAYTIASAPERPSAVQLCVRRGPGKAGALLQKLEPGSTVTVEGPHGEFLLPSSSQRVVFLAGDTGIAPVRSIVLHMLASKDQRAIVVLYEPDQRHILYSGDFDPLARNGDIVHESGPIEGLITRNRSAILDSAVMAAGFEPFLDRCREALEGIGYDSSALIVESFGPQP